MIALGLLAQLAVVTHVPERAAACEPIELSVAVTARGSSHPLLLPPALAGFEILRAPSAPLAYPTPGQPGFRTSEFRYVIATSRVGTSAIPAFEARYGGTAVTSAPARVTVAADPRRTASVVTVRARVDTGLNVRLDPMTAADTVYVGQQATYEVAVFIAPSDREQLKRSPTFIPPEMPSVLTYDIPALGSQPRSSIGSECFDALVYQKAIFPVMPGRFVIPPARLEYYAPVGSGVFSREETREIYTDSVVVIAIEPPALGRPDAFRGAVGSLRVNARVDAARERVGNSILLTVRVDGTGNVKLFPRPELTIPWAGLVRGPERVYVDTTARRVRGSKEFDWVLTPRIAGEFDVPPIAYNYYDPDRRRYDVATTYATHLSVEKGTLAADDTLRTDNIPPIRDRYRGPIGRPFTHQPVVWALFALVPLPVVGRRLLSRRKGQRVSERALLQRSEATGDPALDAATTRRVFIGAIGRRLGRTAANHARPGSLARALRRAGVSKKVADDAEQLLRALELAAYSGSASHVPGAFDEALTIMAAVDAEALPSPDAARRLTAWSLVVGLVLTARTIVAAVPNDPLATFDAGVRAYQGREYATARARFAEVASGVPRSADAWANLGTSAWMLGDTARAIEGWQRALRLEPLASDMRDRTQIVQRLGTRSAGYVPAVPSSMLMILAFLLWGACWALVWLRRTAGWVPAIAAVLLAVGARSIAQWQSGSHRAVVRAATALYAEPSIGSDRGPSTIGGEVVRTFEERAAWTRIVLDDRRSAWVETSSLIPLDR